MNLSEWDNLKERLEKVNIYGASTVVLTKMVRDHMKCDLSDALIVAKALKLGAENTMKSIYP